MTPNADLENMTVSTIFPCCCEFEPAAHWPGGDGAPTFVALAIGANLVGLEFQQTFDRLRILGGLTRGRASRHGALERNVAEGRYTKECHNRHFRALGVVDRPQAAGVSYGKPRTPLVQF